MKAKMFINLVRSIVKSTEFNLNNADKLDVVRSAFTAGASLRDRHRARQSRAFRL